MVWPLSSKKAIKHQIGIEKKDSLLTQSASYKAEPERRKLEKQEIEGVDDLAITEPGHTHWASTVMFFSNRDGV